MAGLFSAFGINWQLLVIQGINFAILLATLTYFLYKPMMKLIDERRAKIAEGVRHAEAARAELVSAQETRGQIVGDAAREAESLVATARTRAVEKSTEITKAAEVQAEALMRDAEARAAEAHRSALAQSERDIARIGVLAAEKILRERAV